VFHNRAALNSLDIRTLTVSSSYIVQGDGLSTTLLLAENVDAGRWAGGPNADLSEDLPLERWVGFTWHEGDGKPGDAAAQVPTQSLGINVHVGESHNTTPQSAALGFARPSSYHAGGVNVAFCDGRVRFISQDISYGVYQALMTPRGSEAMFVSRDGTTPPQPLPAEHAARQKVEEEHIP
jgi:prepilin-type processing-associated H-X9-DG protein